MLHARQSVDHAKQSVEHAERRWIKGKGKRTRKPTPPKKPNPDEPDPVENGVVDAEESMGKKLEVRM